MTTRLRSSRDYEHDVAEFAVALADPDFHRARLDAGSGGEIECHQAAGTPSDGTVDVTVRQPVPRGHVPASVASLLTGVLVLQRTEHWTLREDRCEGTVEVVVPRAPVRAQGRMRVTALGSGCRLEVVVGITVSVPLAGVFVEAAVAEGVRALTRVEHENITAWLAEHAGSQG